MYNIKVEKIGGIPVLQGGLGRRMGHRRVHRREFLVESFLEDSVAEKKCISVPYNKHE